MFPFLYAPTFQYPLSGNVTQEIAPQFGEIAGIPEVEWEVIRTEASYGTQLGKLTDAVLALADKAGLEGPEIDALREIAAGVEEAKGRALAAVRERAAKAAGDVKRVEGGLG
jgi:hypothetical protein